MMKKVLTLTSTTVVPTDFTEFTNLSEINHRAITFTMMNMIDELKKELNALKLASRPQGMGKEPTASDTPVKVDKAHAVPIPKEEVVPVAKPTNSGDGNFNRKIGKTSKYRLVSFNKKEQTFVGQLKVADKNVRIAQSKDELKCALMVDAYLDESGDTKHIRNRDNNPEVMEAYLAAKATATTKSKSGW